MINLAFFKGFLLSISLTSSIGAQNIFLLKQGVAKQYVFSMAMIFFLSDVLLMSLGVLGVGGLLAQNKVLSLILGIGGVIFTLYLAFSFIKSALSQNSSFSSSNTGKKSFYKLFLTALGVTFLNPQVYLDTVFLIGSASLVFDFHSKLNFLAGALSASFLWFFAVGFGARKLSVILSKPKIAKGMDILAALIMLAIAYSLILYLLNLE